jgi:(p)ppGpp synthase/HD superfamily hydrolase
VGRLPRASSALAFAEHHHAGQRRSTDGAPFIEHPLEVGELLFAAGTPDHVIAAGLLHDVLEKTEVTDAELRAQFGVRIARLVEAVSEDQSIRGYASRKAALRRQARAAGREAMMVFAADKVSKVRELRAAVASAALHHERVDPALVSPRRLRHFRRCLEVLEERLGDWPLVHQLRRELTGLQAELAASATTPAAA